MARRAVVTGAFSFTGAAVARELGRRGWTVHTLTNRRPPAGAETITAAPLRFEAEHLERELGGAQALVNTYWIRIPRRGQTFATAVANSRTLIAAAERAGVGRLVHLSVSNADAASRLGYYRAKAEVDEAVRASRLSRAIVRPTLIVGPGDVLTNNIAWFLRRLPLFLVPGGGRYRLQPVLLDDAARIIADAAEAGGELDLSAAGPEVLTFLEYVRLVGRACGLRRLILGAPRWLAVLALRPLELLLRDVVLTADELAGLTEERLLSRDPPAGRASVTDWILEHGAQLGRRYANDLRRHFGRGKEEPIAVA